MASVLTLARMHAAALRGCVAVAGQVAFQRANNNRNNASHPRAGD
ncbi:hypothetical protein [Agrilutibacter terrestris]|nr:hypothetical protein [Lysobacter terrestris]